jgi:hypothetical protein
VSSSEERSQRGAPDGAGRAEKKDGCHVTKGFSQASAVPKSREGFGSIEQPRAHDAVSMAEQQRRPEAWQG